MREEDDLTDPIALSFGIAKRKSPTQGNAATAGEVYLYLATSRDLPAVLQSLHRTSKSIPDGKG